MTVAELIRKLRNMPQQARVIIADHGTHVGGDIDRVEYRDTEWHGSRVEVAILLGDE
jgi:hypothetical protein